MMHALEVRVPFLDPRLVEFAFTKVPSTWKCNGEETRRLERVLARRWLPPTLDVNRKQGFSVPLDDWFRSAGADRIRARLTHLPDVIDRGAVEELIQGHMAGRANSSRLFALVMLAACCRKFAARTNGDPVAPRLF
jgi:asparagine synthase (glutamine-hydrolysing)